MWCNKFDNRFVWRAGRAKRWEKVEDGIKVSYLCNSSYHWQLFLDLYLFLLYDEEETHESLFKLPPNLNNYIFTNIYIIHTHTSNNHGLKVIIINTLGNTLHFITKKSNQSHKIDCWRLALSGRNVFPRQIMFRNSYYWWYF